MNKVLKFAEGKMSESELADVLEKEEQLKSGILFAREYLKTTKLTTDQLVYLCEEVQLFFIIIYYTLYIKYENKKNNNDYLFF